MIGRGDSTIGEMYSRIKHIVDDVYRKKGLRSDEIRKYFLIKKNFKKIIGCLGDLKYVYEEGKYPISFDSQVYDILFYRVLMDRIYFEKDNPQEENALDDYDAFIS